MSTQLDTPHRASSASVSATAEPTAPDQVMAAVKKDINRNTVLIPRDLFLDRILENHITPVDKVVKAIMSESYEKNEGQWKGFPKAGKEDQFYPKFVELANNINDKVLKLPGAAVDTAVGRWIDCHSQIPNANADFVAEIWPDCAFVSNEKVVKEAVDSFTSRKSQQTLFESKPEKQVNDAEIWWRQMIAVVEVKRQDGDQLYLGAFPQLCNYVRRIFRQQLDRRFVLGISISFNNISMWLCDRSGGMGMSEPYDIHKNPEVFICMIDRMGSYPKAIQRCPIYQPSYQIRAVLKTGLSTTSKTEPDVSNTQRLLTLIDDRNPNKVQKHNIILARRPLLIRTAEGMNGRAVQTQQGYLEKDENKERRSPLVIKTSWQSVSKTQNNQPHGVYFYDLIPEFRKRILAASVVKAGHGLESNNGSPEEVSMFGFICQGVQKQADFDAGDQMNNNVGRFSKPKVRSGRTEHPADKKQIDEMKETMAFMAFGDPAFSADYKYFAKDLSRVTDRGQTRIVLKVWGWPIKFFKDLRELLMVLRDAIIDHQTMYKHRILHRDISVGNIIIQPASPDDNLPLWELVTRTCGKLIDLDHAKQASQKMAPSAVGPSNAKVIFQKTHDAGKLEVAASRFYPKKAGAMYYYERAMDINIFKANLNGDLPSPKDLGWEDVGKVPDFQSHVPSVIERTGTIPFISHELLTHEESTMHNAIHDLESFWWIIIYLCLTRESGGGHRRKDVAEEASNLIRDLFESSDLKVGKTKAKYFHKENGAALFDALLLKHFPEYFASLKPMLKRWRDVLVLGYTFKAYEYHLVHKYVLRIIADTMKSLPAAPERSAVIDTEIRRREEDYGYTYVV